jgi:hypothetical protein
MVQAEGLAVFGETAPVMKIFSITGCAWMKTRVTAVSSRYPAQNVEWILFFDRTHSSSIKTEILVFLGNFYLLFSMLLWPRTDEN